MQKKFANVMMTRGGEFHAPNGVVIRVGPGTVEVFPSETAKEGEDGHFDNVFKRIVRAICAPEEARIVLPEFLQFDSDGGACCTVTAYAPTPNTVETAAPAIQTRAPSIGGVPIAASTAPAERKPRGRKPKEQQQPAQDNGPPSPFKEEMAKIDEAHRAPDWLPKEVVIVAEPPKVGAPDPNGGPVVFEPENNDMNVGQAPPVGSVDWFLDLFLDPPLPPDLSPLDSRRTINAREFLDTCYTRALFQRPVALEQGKTSYEELLDTLPAEPIVDMSSDEGVRAFVEVLYAVQDRASKMGMEIPQIEAFLLLGTKEQVFAQAVDVYRKRRSAQQ